MTGPSGIDGLLESRRQVVEGSEPGLAAARLLADVTADGIRLLAEVALAGLRSRWAVVALGGFGAGRLLPGSDLDLLVLTDRRAAGLKDALTAVLYPLWNAGLQVGHQVRTRREQLAIVRDDLTVLTSALSYRLVAGDGELAADTLGRTAAEAGRRSGRVLEALRSRERRGSPYLLEPDLKEGAGGQRDLDEIRWTACVLEGRPNLGPAALLERGLLAEDEAALLPAAEEALCAARWALHRLLPRPDSVLDAALAPDLPLDAERLQASLADVHHVLLRVRRRLAGDRVGYDGHDRWGAQRVLEACRRGPSGLDALEEAAWAGRLETLLPGARDLMSARRPGHLHTLTVGAHSLATAAAAAETAEDDVVAQRARDALRDDRVLLVAALTHDLGKRVHGPGHTQRGAPAAHRAARRFGLPEWEATDVARLVLEHLLLPETAASRDLTDEEAVGAAAERVGRRGLLGPLYLLASADARATGPGAWSPWHAALVGGLVARLDAALAEDVPGTGIAADAERVRTEALSIAEGDPLEPRLAAFLLEAPDAYLASRTGPDAVNQARLVAAAAERADEGACETLVAPGPVEGTWRVTVAAADRPGLFATLAGVVALSGLAILSGEAFTDARGTALDTFVVSSATRAAVAHETWAAFERHLRAALAGRLSLGARLAERRRHYPARAGGPVSVEASVGPNSAEVRVTAPDRVGLLHDLSAALSRGGLDVRSATLLTEGGTARDTFRVTSGGRSPQEHTLGPALAALRRAAEDQTP